MEISRRSLLKGLTAAAGMTVLPATVEAREKVEPRPDAKGLLYDATRCIGCKSCVVACKEANHLPADTTTFGGGLYDAPAGLNQYTKNVIQLYREGDEYSFVKKQCMHCVDPGCVNACMLGAMHKGEYGIVSWNPDRCVGCRYCEVACPFEVPKFEWSSAAPKIVKCELCRDRIAEGKEPACSEVCPRQAVIYGSRDELLQDARNRLKDSPDKYVPKIYGETELGGTQVLYLSHIPFEDLGFRFQDEASAPNLQQTVQSGIYQGFVAPIALYAVLGAVMFRNRRKTESESTDSETGKE